MKAKIKLHCECGQSFTLRGVFNGETFDTGFKKCTCGNEDAKKFKLVILERYPEKPQIVEAN